MEIKKSLLEYYQFCKKEEWENAKNTLLSLENEEKKSFWYFTNLSSVYYELRDYQEALKYSDIAFSIEPESPLVLWDRGGVLYALKRIEEAVIFWEKIMAIEDNKIAFELTSEGIKWAISLKNDCRFRLGQCFYLIEEDDKALNYIDEHLRHRKRGLMSLYTKKEILNFREKILLR